MNGQPLARLQRVRPRTLLTITGIGVPPGPAVSAVLTYRLATHWLPVIPGWAAWRLLQRRDYI